MQDEIKRILSDLKKVKIIETSIDPEIHLEFNEILNNYKKKGINIKKIIADSDLIFDVNTDIETKKNLLIKMSAIDDIKIFRKLEKYNNNPDKELSEWSKIAYQESLATIQSSLLDEDLIVISTGLGAKNNKIRFFLIFKAENITLFSEKQKETIEKELNYAFKKHDCEIERIEFGQYFFSVIALFPLNPDNIEAPLQDFIDELKLLGIVLSEKYILTNVKIIPIEECEKLLEEMEQKSKSVEDQTDTLSEDSFFDSLFDDDFIDDFDDDLDDDDESPDDEEEDNDDDNNPF